MGSYRKIIQNDSNTNSLISFPEEKMKFFVVSQDDKEDESRYFGSPYNSKEKECDFIENHKEEQWSVLTLARQNHPEEISKLRDIPLAQKNIPYHKKNREEQPSFSPEAREVTQSQVYPKRREVGSIHPRVCMDIRRSDTARIVAHQPEEHLEESVPVEIRSVSAIDPEFFQESSNIFSDRNEEFFVEHPDTADFSSVEIDEEKEIVDEGEIPGNVGRSFEREYPGYAYMHLGQRFEEPPSYYFPLEIKDVKEARVIEWKQKEEVPVFSTSFFEEEDQKYSEPAKESKEVIGKSAWDYRNPSSFKKISQKIKIFFAFLWRAFIPEYFSFGIPKFSYAYLILGGILLTGFGTLSFVMKGMNLQGSVLGISNRGVDGALLAVDAFKQQDFSASSQKFEEASQLFRSASDDIVSWAGVLSDVPLPIPILSKISSGKNALEAGEHLALAGKYMSEIVETATNIRNSGTQEISLLEMFQKSVELSDQARMELILAQEFLQKVRLSDIPEEKRDRFTQLKQTIPVLLEGLDVVHTNAPAFTDVLGGNGPRKYLFLFQNNNEARATGGFIGSYGLLDMKDGEIRKFFIDGIFNPDGQLKVNIVPPQPVRKVSAAWSLHDSNWFADFPTSAEKAMFFYEKTGGATVDGVITITPVLLQRLLEATGSVYLSEYDVTIDAQNVIEKLQYKVEVDYDKEENRPKKILGDLAPILLDRIMHMKDPELVERVIEGLHASLREKHVLLYSRNEALQDMYRELGWSGELKETSNDFLSVVNSNVNGYKTDGVIEQSIRHNAQIQDDGTVLDTVTIIRKHNGGDTPYEWWNAVNANYMRVYVPKGAQLISVKGHTRETVKDPLDYDALDFQRDELLEKIEGSLSVHPESGTQIFEESGKTVFGNWVYVSPKESVTVEYTYVLPFRMMQSEKQKEIPYSLLTQKQSGSLPSSFTGTVSYPKDWKISWFSPSGIRKQSEGMIYEGSLATDVFQGYVFERK